MSGEESVLSLSSMFPNIDRQVIKQVFLSCGKDFDQTLEKLLMMGNEELAPKRQQPAPTPVPVPVPIAPVVSLPFLPTSLSDTPIPSGFGYSIPPVHEDFAEQKRLETLKQELASEYQRLAEKQKQNLEIEKRISELRVHTSDEQEVLRKEQDALRREQALFQEEKKQFEINKKTLETQLTSKFIAMKEEMKKQEEDSRRVEEERRFREDEERAHLKERKKKENEALREAENYERMKCEQERAEQFELQMEEKNRAMEEELQKKQDEFSRILHEKDTLLNELREQVLHLQGKKVNNDEILENIDFSVHVLVDKLKKDLMTAISHQIKQEGSSEDDE